MIRSHSAVHGAASGAIGNAVRLVAAAVVAAGVVLSVATPAHAARSPRPHPHRKPWPVTVTIQTVPALPGVRFTFDRTALVTDANGRTSFTKEHNFTMHSLSLVDTAIDLPDRRYRFARWAGQRDPDQAFRPAVSGLPMRANYTVTAAFNVQYPVSARFVDEQGRPLDVDRISAVKIKRDTGQILDLPKSGTAWLDGVQATYRKSTLAESEVSYSLQSVVMDGTNIVDAGRQRFSPATTSVVTVTGQLRDLTVRARDALYGDPVGTRAMITRPDGTTQTVPFGPGRTAVLRNLPRGTYRVSVVGANGMVLADQVRLSRDAALDVAVVSASDLATVSGAGLVIAVALVLIGRVRPRRYLLRVLSRLIGHRRAWGR